MYIYVSILIIDFLKKLTESLRTEFIGLLCFTLDYELNFPDYLLALATSNAPNDIHWNVQT